MKFFKGKIVGVIVGALATAALMSLGVPPQVAAPAGKAVGDQAQELMSEQTQELVD